jgi:hypothetical protein
MKEQTYRKRVEPVLGIIIVLFVFVVGPSAPHEAIMNHTINPSPYVTYCTDASYPWGCDMNENEKCIRGGERQVGRFLISAVLFFVFGVMLISMSLIVLSFYQSDRATVRNQRRQQPATTTISNTQEVLHVGDEALTSGIVHTAAAPADSIIAMDTRENLEEHKLTCKITSQALMYLAAFVLTYSFGILTFSKTGDDGRLVYGDIMSIQILRSIFAPLQGFFNMLIFLHHKVDNLRRAKRNESLPLLEALRSLFRKPEIAQDVFVSMISMVIRDRALREEEQQRQQQDEEEESDSSDDDEEKDAEGDLKRSPFATSTTTHNYCGVNFRRRGSLLYRSTSGNRSTSRREPLCNLDTIDEGGCKGEE